MKGSVFILIYALGPIFILLIGLLMLLSPERYIQFLNWWTRADSWSQPNLSWKVGRAWPTRFGGLLFIMGGIVMISPVITWVLNPTPIQVPFPEPQPAAPRRADWLSFGIGLVGIMGGLYILIQPQGFVRWSLKGIPHRLISESKLEKAPVWLRVMAAFVILGGMVAMLTWLRSL